MIGGVLNLDQLFKAINETLYMTAVSLVLATVYCTVHKQVDYSKIRLSIE